MLTSLNTHNLIHKILYRYNLCIRRFLQYKWRLRIDRTQDRVVICNNCVGCMVLNDFGLKYNSPFVNLFIRPNDYIKLLKNINFYLSDSATLMDVTDGNNYPVGLLNDIKIHFLHYKSFDEAKLIWFKRLNRMKKKEYYVVFIQQEGCTIQHLREFENLEFTHKVCLVNKEMPSIKSSKIIKGYNNRKTLGIITEFCGYRGMRFYDQFNWRDFLNLKIKNIR